MPEPKNNHKYRLMAGFQDQYLQRPPEQDPRIAELAERYHHETEAYDRTVCSGPILHGLVMPANGREFVLINKNARLALRQVLAEAAQAGIPRLDMQRAISRHVNR